MGTWKGVLREAGTVPWGPVRELRRSELGGGHAAVPWPVAPGHMVGGGGLAGAVMVRAWRPFLSPWERGHCL